MRAEHEKSYVLFPLGEERFAVPAEAVTELARPDQLQTFPHCTPSVSGVLLRRGKIVPVCDVASVLVGSDAPARKFYLIANCQRESGKEWTAIPVTGECELTNVSIEPEKPATRAPSYITGILAVGDATLKIVDLDKLITIEAHG